MVKYIVKLLENGLLLMDIRIYKTKLKNTYLQDTNRIVNIRYQIELMMHFIKLLKQHFWHRLTIFGRLGY